MNTPENNPGIKEPNSIKDGGRGLPFCVRAELAFLAILSAFSLSVALNLKLKHSDTSSSRLRPYPMRSVSIDYLNIGQLNGVSHLVEIICPSQHVSEALRVENTIKQIEDRIDQNKGKDPVLALLQDALTNQTKIAQICPPTT